MAKRLFCYLSDEDEELFKGTMERTMGGGKKISGKELILLAKMGLNKEVKDCSNMDNSILEKIDSLQHSFIGLVELVERTARNVEKLSLVNVPSVTYSSKPSGFQPSVEKEGSNITLEKPLSEKQILFRDSIVKRIVDKIRYDGFNDGQTKSFDSLEEINGLNEPLLSGVRDEVQAYVNSKEDLDKTCFVF